MSVAARFPKVLWLIPCLGVAKVVAWLLLAGWENGAPGGAFSSFLVVIFTFSGILLIAVGRPQPAPARLGAVFLLTGSAFTDAALLNHGTTLPVTLVASTRPSYFLPVFLWGLAAVFPRIAKLSPGRSAAEVLVLISSGLSSIPFVATFLFRFPTPTGIQGVGAWNDIGTPVAWAGVYGLCLASLFYMALRSRRAQTRERLRVKLFLGALALGTAPLLLSGLVLILFPPLLESVTADPVYLNAIRGIAYFSLALIPPLTFYAVLAHRALGLRGAARSAVRILLAKQTAWLVILMPFVLLVVLVSAELTGLSVDLVNNFQIVGITGLTILGATTLLGRRHILGFIERRFFPDREGVDEELEILESDIESSTSVPELTGTVRAALEHRLRFSSGFLFLFDSDRRELRAARGEAPVPPMDPGTLQELLDGNPAKVRRRTDFKSPAMKRWFALTEIEVLVPFSSDSSGRKNGAPPLGGAVATGAKASELPLTLEDERRLRRIAGAAETALRAMSQLGTESAESRTSLRQRSAGHCTACDTVWALSSTTCNSCGSPLRPLSLDYIIGDRYQLVRLVGKGGMGVVFEARDLDLSRSVALKTLPYAQTTRVEVLRQEARVTARLSHPNLATIYDVRICRGTPVLVIEYFSLGTLRDRIDRGKIEWPEALEIGVWLAQGTRYLHQNLIVHGDIKPSNVGFSSPDQVKLLDFGITRFLPEVESSKLTSKVEPSEPGRRVHEDEAVRWGTTAYLPPEIIARQKRPGLESDLWALAVTLFEAISGRHPFLSDSLRATAARILTTEPPDVREFNPDCPAPVAAFLRQALAQSPEYRPGTATLLMEQLQQVRQETVLD